MTGCNGAEKKARSTICSRRKIKTNIEKSIKEFDRGDEKEAQRLATHLRVLFHETQKSKSIFGQLKPQIIFYSSGDLYTPSNLFTSWTLLDLMVSPEGIKYNAKSNNQSRCFFDV